MAKQTKPKIGRPKLPKGEAKGRIVPIRFNPQDIKRIEAAAKASQKTVSEWVRSTINAAMQEVQA
jgi:predicted HicB family RNase H-like nuclease